MGRTAVLLCVATAAACSSEPSFGTGATSATGATTSSSTLASSGASSDSSSPSSTTSGGEGGSGGDGGDPSGPGSAGGGGEGGNVVDGPSTGSGGAGGGPPDGCGDGEVQPSETCDLGPDVISELCVDCQVVCPQDWERAPSGTSCLRRYDLVGSMNMFAAESACEALQVGTNRARLAAPKVQEDLDAVLERCDGGICYVGAFDLEGEGSFRWIDGEPFDDATYPVWATGQPDNLNDRQDCVGVLPGEDGAVLQDAPCDANGEFVCEILPGWAEDDLCGNAQLDPGEDCEGDVAYCTSCNRVCESPQEDLIWMEQPFAGHTCFLGGGVAGIFDAAVAYCGDLADARLATPDALEDLAVARYACGADNCWIGARDPVTDGVYTWLGSGEPFDYVNQLPPWKPGEPANGAAALCVITNEGLLDDYPCETADPRPLCERGE